MSIWFVRILLLALPLWLIAVQLRLRRAGKTPPLVTRVNVLLVLAWLVALGWVIAHTIRESGAPGSGYRPAHVENGRIVPGEIEPGP